MGTGVLGKDKLVHIHDGADPGEMVEVPHQGDATFNPGKSANISVQKNSKMPYNSDEGASVTFSIKKERPALAAHTRLRTLAATGEEVDVEYRDKHSGGESQSGKAVITLGEEGAGTEGLLEQQVTVSFVDDPVPGIVP